jgi:uncharacterized membrane protein YccF (DUF307 family)
VIGLPLAIMLYAAGIALMLTIVGIPAGLALMAAARRLVAVHPF